MASLSGILLLWIVFMSSCLAIAPQTPVPETTSVVAAATATALIMPATPLQRPLLEPTALVYCPNLVRREYEPNPASQGASQFPTITTWWVETTMAGVSTWVPVVYTQTFAKVPDQLPPPGIGQIGLGTLAEVRRGSASHLTETLLGGLFHGMLAIVIAIAGLGIYL